jgi:hypothetical protein
MTQSNEKHVSRAAAVTKTYDRLGTFPPDEPTVRIVFHGLMCFFFDSKNKTCEVGIHNTTHGNSTHAHPHELSIGVWLKSPNGDCLFEHPGKLPGSTSHAIGNVTIDVDDSIAPPGVADGIYVYQSSTSFIDERNWSHVIDFEDIYGPLTKSIDSNTLKPSVRINKHGVFYTLHRTESQFVLHPEDGSADKSVGQDGHVAEFVAANIYLKSTGSVTLNAPILPIPLVLSAATGLKYQIDIMNNCRKGGAKCVFHPASTHKEERNDFYLYYENFKWGSKPNPEFQLIKTPSGEPNPDWAQRLKICIEPDVGRHFDADDKAPCGATGYGGTSGLP